MTSANFSLRIVLTSSSESILGANSDITARRALYSSNNSVLSAGQVSICSLILLISFNIAWSTISSGISSRQPESIASFLAADTSTAIESFLALSLAFMASIIAFCNVVKSISITSLKITTINCKSI